MFRKLMAAVGVGGAEVETELFTPGVQPGGHAEGVIRLRSGPTRQHIERVAVEFVTRVEREFDDVEDVRDLGFGRLEVRSWFEVAPGEVVEIPFGVRAPMETPITFYNGRHLPGVAVSLRTIVEVSGAVDPRDSDPIGVGALPAQHVVLDAVERLGFQLRSADVEGGWLHNTPQQLPFYQEIEFSGSPRFPRLAQLEVTFVAADHGMSVILEADKRAGLISAGRDVLDALWVDYGSLEHTDWAAELHRRLDALSAR
ncbi:sporulation protein [Nocardia sp. GCM10030253]|uniref:sporulation protein n=1 Tax=Nocardia sp. GCM10030253 TaxID=3273404 RepID=UPI0036349B75